MVIKAYVGLYFIRFKDTFGGGAQHTERQNFLLLTALKERRVPGRAAQWVAPGDNVTASLSCRSRLCMASRVGLARFPGLSMDWLILIILAGPGAWACPLVVWYLAW